METSKDGQKKKKWNSHFSGIKNGKKGGSSNLLVKKEKEKSKIKIFEIEISLIDLHTKGSCPAFCVPLVLTQGR